MHTFIKDVFETFTCRSMNRLMIDKVGALVRNEHFGFSKQERHRNTEWPS